MADIDPVSNDFIDEIIKVNQVGVPDPYTTSGEGLRELVKLLRDRLEQEISKTAAAAGSAAMPVTGWSAPESAAASVPLYGGRLNSRMVRAANVRTLAFLAATSNLASVPAGVTDVSTTDALYGTTALQATLTPNTAVTIAPSANVAVPFDISAGIIRIWLKPIQNVGNSNLDKFSIELHSAGTPSAATANYHQLAPFTTPFDLNGRLTSLAGEGRWQCYSVAVSQFVAAGTGAELYAIKFARLILRSKTGAPPVIVQVGNIEFTPNAVTKAKCILSFDDSYLSQYTYAAPQMARYGFKGVLFPSPAATTIGVSPSKLTTKQIIHLHDDLRWQIGSQAWSTESGAVIDAMTGIQRTAEFAGLAAWQKALGLSSGVTNGSYFGDITQRDMVAYPELRKMYTTMRSFAEGNSAAPVMLYNETFPYGDPMNIRALNGATASWGANSTTLLKSFIDQVIASKGVAYLVWHDELASPGNARTAFDALLAYLDANRGFIEVVTQEELEK